MAMGLGVVMALIDAGLALLINWEHKEAGWYEHRVHGVVTKEQDGWWHYPPDETGPYGPYRTAKSCMEEIDGQGGAEHVGPVDRQHHGAGP